MLAIFVFPITIVWPLCQGFVPEEMVGDWPRVDNEQATHEQATQPEQKQNQAWTLEMRQAWRWRELWTAEMEQAWLDSKSWPPNNQEAQEEEVAATGEEEKQEVEAMDEVSFGITGMLYTRSLDARRPPREILKYRFTDIL